MSAKTLQNMQGICKNCCYGETWLWRVNSILRLARPKNDLHTLGTDFGRGPQKSPIFVDFFQAVCLVGAHTFRSGPRPKHTPMGHTYVRKVVRPRSEAWFPK